MFLSGVMWGTGHRLHCRYLRCEKVGGRHGPACEKALWKSDSGRRVHRVRKGGRGASSRSHWPVPLVTLEAMRDEDIHLAIVECDTDTCQKEADAGRCRCESHGAAPGWRLQRCAACSFSVTGVLPDFCCKFCKKTPGCHGPACLQLQWRPLVREEKLLSGQRKEEPMKPTGTLYF